ncbi:MAG: hypothetical protein IKC26_05750 [Clostridia bacterium]|nr:hypothetical protein [Clostridia bacterium]
MKRILCLLLLIILVSSVAVSFLSCGTGERVPSGTYSCIAGDTGEQYIFDGRRVRVLLYIMGETAIDFSGSYRLSGDEITFDFPDDTDGIYSGTRSYAISEDGSRVTIDKDVFTKE